MKIKDIVYGETIINEPVLLELIKSQHIQRLKKISQYGIPDKYYHHKNFSRYEHSLGVMLLLRKLGATLEEQVAGLLHDVSVLAFSHIADWIFGEGKNGNEGYHDTLHARFVSQTEIPKILSKYRFSERRVSNSNNFTLLEKEIPDLCADRVDYALREFQYWLSPKAVKVIIRGIYNLNGEITFLNKASAYVFASNFLKLQTLHWGGKEAVRRYNLFSRTLKIALAQKIIKEGDFFKGEDIILQKIEKSGKEEIMNNLKKLRNKPLEKVKGKNIVKKKFRYVDPKIFAKTKLVRLSEINPKFQRLLEKHQKINQRGVYV